MCKQLASIYEVDKAVQGLSRACATTASRQEIVEQIGLEKQFKNAFSTPLITPGDMLEQLWRIK